MSRDIGAARHILQSPYLADRITPFIDAGGYIDWDAATSFPAWSSGELVLIQIAAELWTGRPYGASFALAVRTLDDDNFTRVMEALRIRRGLVAV